MNITYQGVVFHVKDAVDILSFYHWVVFNEGDRWRVIFATQFLSRS